MHRLTKALPGSTCLTVLSTAAAEAVPMLEPAIGFGNTYSIRTLLSPETVVVTGKDLFRGQVDTAHDLRRARSASWPKQMRAKRR